METPGEDAVERGRKRRYSRSGPGRKGIQQELIEGYGGGDQRSSWSETCLALPSQGHITSSASLQERDGEPSNKHLTYFSLAIGTEFEQKDTKSIVLATARDPELAHVFNHASMAHNNHFFFDHLSPAPVKMGEKLFYHINENFGSVDTLRDEMIGTAVSMFGPGFVWLVRTQLPGQPVALRVMATYLAGSPYPGAHWRRQEADAQTAVGSSPEGLANGKRFLQRNAAGHQGVKLEQTAPGGTDLIPILCLNTWEYAWLREYGTGVGGMGGKLAYAQSWWNMIDWAKVEEEAKLESRVMAGGDASVSPLASLL